MDQMQQITLTKEFPFKTKNDYVEIHVRLRGYSNLPEKYNNYNERRRAKEILKNWVNNRNLNYKKGLRPPEQRPRSQTISSLRKENKFEKVKIKEDELKDIKRSKGLIPQHLYYTFTSIFKSNKIIISKTPLRGKFINNNIKIGKDLENINGTKLKNISKIYEYDSVFSEQDKISDIYKQIVEQKVKKMFNGFNSSMFIMGPKKSGKTYILIGNHKNKGILTYTMNTLFHYMNLSQEGMKCFYGIAASYVVTMQVEQFYLEYKDIICNENIIFGIMNFNTIIEQLDETRKKFCDKYRIKDLIRKSNLVITFTLYQNNTGDLKFLEKNNNLLLLKETNDIQEISKFSFIEMNDAHYAFNLPKAPTPKIYRDSQSTYEDLSNISIQSSRKIQPEDPLTFIMQNLYDTVISCGTSIIILLCANPCEPHIDTEGQILEWGFHLRNKLNSGIYYNDNFHLNNFNYECKYIESYLNVDSYNFQISNFKNLKKGNYGTKGKIKEDNYDFINTNYQTLRDLEITSKELEKIKKEQNEEKKNYDDRFKQIEEQVNNLKLNKEK